MAGNSFCSSKATFLRGDGQLSLCTAIKATNPPCQGTIGKPFMRK